MPFSSLHHRHASLLSEFNDEEGPRGTEDARENRSFDLPERMERRKPMHFLVRMTMHTRRSIRRLVSYDGDSGMPSEILVSEQEIKRESVQIETSDGRLLLQRTITTIRQSLFRTFLQPRVSAPQKMNSTIVGNHPAKNVPSPAAPVPFPSPSSVPVPQKQAAPRVIPSHTRTPPAMH